MNYHLEQSKATKKDERDQDIDGLVLDGLNSLTGSQPLSLESTDMSAFEQNQDQHSGERKARAGHTTATTSKPSDKDLLPEYLKAVKTAAGSPDNTGAKLLSAVGTYVDAINKSPANKYYGGDHQSGRSA